MNGRGLDVRVNTPPGFDALEPTIRHAAKARFSRGSLQVSVRIEPSEAQQLEVNRSGAGQAARCLAAIAAGLVGGAHAQFAGDPDDDQRGGHAARRAGSPGSGGAGDICAR